MFTVPPSIVLKSCFDRVMGLPVAQPRIRALKFSTAFALSSDFHPITDSGIPRFVRGFGDAMRLVKMTQAIDDVVDTTDLSVLAAADFTRDAQGICNFLHNRNFVPADYLPALQRLSDKNILDFATGVQFSNIFCDYIHDRAVRQLSLAQDHDEESRRKMAADNVDFSGIFGSFFFGFVQRPRQSWRDGVSHETVRYAYPEIYQINRAGQMQDDLADLMLDIEDERVSGQVSPNIIMAQTDRDVLLEFSESAAGKDDIYIADMPDVLRRSVSEIEERYYEAIKDIRSVLSRNVIESFWRTTKAGKILTPSHPLIVKKRANDNKTIQSLALKPATIIPT